MILKNIVIAKTPQVDDLTELFKKYNDERETNKKEYVIGVNADSTKFYRIQGYASFQHPNGYNSISLGEIASILKLSEQDAKTVLENPDAYFDGEDLHLEDFAPFAVNDEPLPAKEEKEQKQIIQNIQTFDKDKLLEEIDQSYGKMIFNNYNLIKDIEQKQDKILQLINDLKNLLNNTIL